MLVPGHLGGRPALATAALALAAVGAAQPLFNVPSSSLLQSTSPAERRGTVVTFVNATLQSVFPLPLLAAGLLLRSASAFALFGAAGVGMVAIAGAVATLFEF